MFTTKDTTDHASGSPNIKLMFILIALVLGVVFYSLIRKYWSSLISEHVNGGVPAQDQTIGLSPSDIEAFPTFIYQGPDKNCNGSHDVGAGGNQGAGNGIGMVNSKTHDGVSVECSICLCDLQQDDVVRMLTPCRHFFHIQCIDVWLYGHLSCPICRTSLQTGSVELTKCSMYPPMSHLHQCNSLGSTDATNIQATSEEITSSAGITEIVVEQVAKIERNTEKITKRSTWSEPIEVQIDVYDEVDIKIGTEECSGKSILTNEALQASNIGSQSKRIPSLGVTYG
ncbi:RING/U-box superfamily protein [Rhynchospora pubera]|uniref:RING-type E3 ubiquitin transferase n=1 Tax=Rhynchospora pubera TaxID=906938 RepID=A0AAV8EP46_9POAL|nr:RING/U-box superfamily protein [Rhynchospora pubera]